LKNAGTFFRGKKTEDGCQRTDDPPSLCELRRGRQISDDRRRKSEDGTLTAGFREPALALRAAARQAEDRSGAGRIQVY